MSFRGGEKTEGGAALLQKGAPPSQPFQLQEEDAFVKASSSFAFFLKERLFHLYNSGVGAGGGADLNGTGLTGGTVNAMNDHRIAMSAAIAATVCRESVTITGAECVAKSYPKFFEEYRRLGGNYEQHLR